MTILFKGFIQDFETSVMLLVVNFGMLSYNDSGYINYYIKELFTMYKNGADKIQLKYYINKYILKITFDFY